MHAPGRIRSIVLTCLLLGVAPQRGAAQGSANNHWKAIDGVLISIGGIERVRSATRPQLGALAEHLLNRAQFFQDLYDLQAQLVLDHALLRDTIAKRDKAPMPAAAYFRARALQELGRDKDAANAYRAVVAPERIRALATTWAATLTPSGPQSWQQDLVDWREGKRAVTTTTCPAGASVCNLFRAVLANDPPAIVRFERELMQAPSADYRATVPARGGQDTVDFYDPLPLYVLSIADYALLAHVVEGQAGAGGDMMRGRAFLRLGRLKDAESALRAAVSAGGLQAQAYLGEALYRTGRQADAEKLWTSVAPNVVNIALDVRGTVVRDSASTVRRFATEKTAGLRRLRDSGLIGAALARALLRVDAASSALEIMEWVNPPSVASDLDHALPAIVVLKARARYVAGMQAGSGDFGLAREGIAILARDIPVLRPALMLMQQITAPTNVPDSRGH